MTSFFKSPAAPSVLLILGAVLSLAAANIFFGEPYIQFWKSNLIGRPLEFWISEGFMTFFFLQIGLELRRETTDGALSDFSSAFLPAFAAAGGMAAPVLVFFFFNAGKPTLRGLGIPMATDIAFAISIISLLRSRLPPYLSVYLKALAIFDDLGAIIVIAFFYTADISILFLAGSVVAALALVGLNRFKVKRLALYFAGGAALWFCMLQSGVQPAISGAALAFAIPSAKSERLEEIIEPWVVFLVLPLFAISNTAMALSANWAALSAPLSLGVFAGLFLGKPAGIFLFSRLSVRLGWAVLPPFVQWKHIFGAGILGGIGFTMSIFITLLAFSDPPMVAQSKTAILLASTASGLAGYSFLRLAARKNAGESLSYDEIS